MWIFLLLLILLIGSIGIIFRAKQEKEGTEKSNLADEFEIIEREENSL